MIFPPTGLKEIYVPKKKMIYDINDPLGDYIVNGEIINT
jgi:hypothetical protein